MLSAIAYQALCHPGALTRRTFANLSSKHRTAVEALIAQGALFWSERGRLQRSERGETQLKNHVVCKRCFRVIWKHQNAANRPRVHVCPHGQDCVGARAPWFRIYCQKCVEDRYVLQQNLRKLRIFRKAKTEDNDSLEIS